MCLLIQDSSYKSLNMKLKYNHKIYCEETNEALFINLPTIDTLELTDGKELIKSCIMLFNDLSIEDVYIQIKHKYQISIEEFTEVVNSLLEFNILKPSIDLNSLNTILTQKNLLKYDRQIKYVESIRGNDYTKQ